MSTVSAETLEEALVKTYQTNPDLAAERAGLRAVEEEISKANAKWWPSISLEGDYEISRSKEKVGNLKFDTKSQNWSADLLAKQPLLTSGRNGANKGQAVARVQAATAKLRAKEQRVLLDAVTAFVDVARNEAVLDLVRNDIVLLQDLFKEFGERRDKGKATDSDVDQIQAALEAARAECIAHTAALMSSWRAYEQVVGEAPVTTSPEEGPAGVHPCVNAKGQRQRSTIKMPDQLPSAPATLEEVEKAAQGSVPELEQARAEAEAADYGVSAAYSELLPSAELSVRLGTSGEETDPQSLSREASVSAGLSIPLFNTGAEWSEIRAAHERNSQARLNITSVQRQVLRDATRAWYDLVSIRAVRSVNKVQAATVLRAFVGLRKEMADPKLHRSITDLLGLRGAFLGTQTALMSSDSQEAIALFQILAAMGKLNPDYLALPVPTDTSHDVVVSEKKSKLVEPSEKE